MFNSTINAVIQKVNALRDQVDDHWQIPLDEARILAQLVRIGRCRSICEVGASYGFSTLHLAAATAPLNGRVNSFEISEKKVAATTQHLTEARLIDVVSMHLGDARDLLGQVKPDQPYDFVFVDAIKDQSFAYFEALQSQLAPRAIIATDNTSTHWDELSSFVDHLRQLPGSSCAIPVGNGFECTVIER